MNAFPTITLCMIVKNEVDCLSRCLNSVEGIVDEIVVVDTGSTDKTIEVCRHHGIKAYSYEWKDDFAEARNYALSLATGDWIFYLDADEELDKDAEKGKILEMLACTKADFVSLPVLNYYGNGMPINDKNVYLFFQPRLFRNHLGIIFKNRIHEELIIPKKSKEKKSEDILLNIHHYGYLESTVKTKRKSNRNIQILQKELAQPEHSPWIEYYLAGEYYRKQEYQQAFIYINQSIHRFLLKNYMPPSLLYKLKYGILIETESLDGAWPAIEKAILLYPDYVDLHFYKGIILYMKKMFTEALKAFEKCLKLGDHHTQYLILKGVGSFRAQEYKELCLEELEKSQ